MKPLSYPMKLALRDIASHNDGDWVSANRFHQTQVNALVRRGLVERSQWYVRLTDGGREVALALYKHKGGAS